MDTEPETPNYGMYTPKANHHIHVRVEAAKACIDKETPREIQIIVDSMLHVVADIYPEATDTAVRESVMEALQS